MVNNTHSFDVALAKEIGIKEAILYGSIYYWIKHNEANDVNFFDGKYWVYNSAKAWAELFPYLSQAQARRIIDKLIELNLIEKGNFNKAGYDRTSWYALKTNIWQNRQMDLAKSSNGFGKIVKPIPVQTSSIPVQEKNKKDDEEKTSPEFEEFYSHYPRKKAPKNAWRAFKKLKPSEVEKVLEVVKSDLFQNAMSKKKNNRGDFRPQPSSWLNAGSWEDEEYSPAASAHTIDHYGDNQHMFLHHLQDDMRTIAVEQHGDNAKQKLLEFYVDAKNAGIKLTHKQWLQKLKDKK